LRVSVIIPTYNDAAYICQAVNSALDQTYSDVEVIVVDDGSTDDTASKLTSYDGRIRYIYQHNQGASAARNRGLQVATGEYICFLDADDRYCANNISCKVAFLEQHPEYAWCYSDWAWVDEMGSTVMLGHEPHISLARLKVSGHVLPLALQGYRLGTNVFMFRRALVEQLGGFDVSLQVLEDYDYYLRASARSPIGFVDAILCYIYQHEGSLGTGCDRTKAYLNRLRLHRKIKRLFAHDLQQPEVQQAWKLQEADLYRNLAILMLKKGCVYRAQMLFNTSLNYIAWQWGAPLMWLKILWARWVKS